MKKIIITEPSNSSWLPVVNTTKTELKNVLVFDADVLVNNTANFNSYLLSPSYRKANNTQVFIPITSFWNETRIYKSLEGKIIRTPSILQFLTNPLSLVDFLFMVKVLLISRSYKDNTTVFQFLANK